MKLLCFDCGCKDDFKKVGYRDAIRHMQQYISVHINSSGIEMESLNDCIVSQETIRTDPIGVLIPDRIECSGCGSTRNLRWIPEELWDKMDSSMDIEDNVNEENVTSSELNSEQYNLVASNVRFEPDDYSYDVKTTKIPSYTIQGEVSSIIEDMRGK